MVTDDNTDYKGKYFVLTNDITLNDDVINEAGTGTFICLADDSLVLASYD